MAYTKQSFADGNVLTAAQLNAMDTQVYKNVVESIIVNIKQNTDGSYSLTDVFGQTKVTGFVQTCILRAIQGKVRIMIDLDIDGYVHDHAIAQAAITGNVYTISSIEYPYANDLSKYLAFSIMFDTNGTDTTFKFTYKDTTGRTYLED